MNYEQRLRGLVEKLLDREQQRTGAEWLGDVPVSPRRQTHSLIGGRRLGTQHDNRQSQAGELDLDVVDEHQARFRHRAQVADDDHVRIIIAQQLTECSEAIARRRHAVPGEFEDVRHQIAVAMVFVDKQQVLLHDLPMSILGGFRGRFASYVTSTDGLR